ncbi:hypothetical protein C7271_06370 [filamentous cyanobacterium CCP5]|nr:hypothetical protein C7271_06370 [filamentous cyanobacterium CCP5]
MAQVSLEAWVGRVRSGELGSFPTDTVPALAARPDRAGQIYTLKQRSPDKPLILMGASLRSLLPYTVGVPREIAIWQRVADRHWPGQLTLVLPASDRVPPAMNPLQTGTIGIRVPAHPLAVYLLERTGPLATTSANRSGQPPLEAIADIEGQFPQVLTLTPAALDQIAADLDQPLPAPSGQPSTVARWTGQGWDIIRTGAVALTATAGLA